MRKFKQNKLWRDKSVDSMIAQGSTINWRKLNLKEFQRCLKEKLVEEVLEVISSVTEDKLIEELADVLEVIETMARAHEFSMSDIIRAKENKNSKRGGFDWRKYIESAEHPKGSFGGELGSLLRKEGLTSSTLHGWRVAQSNGLLRDTKARKRGPEKQLKSSQKELLSNLQKENASMNLSEKYFSAKNTVNPYHNYT